MDSYGVLEQNCSIAANYFSPQRHAWVREVWDSHLQEMSVYVLHMDGWVLAETRKLDYTLGSMDPFYRDFI